MEILGAAASVTGSMQDDEPNGQRWLPEGPESGNPGGRPKLPAEMREAFQGQGPTGSGSADPVPAVCSGWGL